MDQLDQYRPIIDRIIGEHLEFLENDPEIEAVSIVDKKKENYLLLEIGWQPPRRVSNIVFYIRLKDGKIWIEEDWTREGIGYQLVSAGVPPAMIELGYQPPEIRQYVELTAS